MSWYTDPNVLDGFRWRCRRMVGRTRFLGLGKKGSAHGSRGVISPSRRFCTSRTTTCAANLPYTCNTNITSVVIRSRTGVCSADRHCWNTWRAALRRSAVLTRPFRSTRASAVGENTIGETLLRASGCLAESNAGTVEHFLFPYPIEPPTH
jgi:hypothetical protein